MYRKFSKEKRSQLEPSPAVSNLQIVLNAKFRSFASRCIGLLLHLQNAAKILHSSIEIVFVLFSLEDVEMSGLAVL